MATKYWISNTPSTWGTSASWSPAGVPASTDDVVFGNAYGTGDCDVDANVSALTVAFSGYTGAFSTSFPLLLSTSGITYGVEIYGNNVNASGAAKLVFGRQNYLQSRGFSYSGPIEVNGRLYIKDSATINNVITNNSINNIVGVGEISGTTTGIDIYVGALRNTGDASLIFYIPVYFNGSTTTSTTSGGNTSFAFKDVTINAGGTVNFAAPLYFSTTSNLFSLNVDPAANTNISAVTVTLTGGIFNFGSSGNPITVGSFDFRSNITVNCLSALYSGGIYYNNTGSGTALINGSNFYTGGIGANGSSTSISGTSLIIFKYGGILVYGTSSFGGIYNNILIDCAPSTLTFTANVNYRGNSLVYNSGTIAPSVGSSWSFYSNAVISSGTSCPFYNVIINNSVTLSAELYCNNGLYLNQTSTIGGTGRFNTGILNATVPGKTFSFTPGPNHLIRTNMNTVGLPGNKIIFNSSIPGTKATLTLNSGAIQSNAYLDGTDIDSSLGQTVWTFAGAISNTVNWSVQPPIPNTLYKIFF